jgi:hypothetical protein
MQETRFSLAAIGLLVVAMAVACAPATTSNAAAPAAAGNATVPLCKSPTTCAAPAAVQNKVDCVNKIPYTNVVVPQGTTYEVLDKSGDFTCSDSGISVGGKPVITCYGKQLNSFDLKLTNSACGGAALVTGTGQCQQGYGYDAAQKCCSPVSADSAGSATVKVDLGACPLPIFLHTP